MAYGEGWEVLVSEEFQSQVDILAESHGRLDEQIEGLIFTADGGPQAIWPQEHMIVNLWCTRILSPVPVLVFFELDEDLRRIEFVIVAEAP